MESAERRSTSALKGGRTASRLALAIAFVMIMVSGCAINKLRYTPESTTVRQMTASQAREAIKKLVRGRSVNLGPSDGLVNWNYDHCPIRDVRFNPDSIVLMTDDAKCASVTTCKYDEMSQYGVWTFVMAPEYWNTRIGEKDSLLFKGSEANARLVSDCLYVLKNASPAERSEDFVAQSPIGGSGTLNIAVSDLEAEGVSQSDAAIVADWLRGALVATGTYTVIERSAMQKVLSEQAFQQTGCTASDCAVRLGKVLNVQRMVVGSFGKFLNSYVLNVRVVDVESGQVVYSDSAKGTTTEEVEANIKDLAQRLAR